MEQHILDLIKENNRVIIPNFGAFIIAKENGYTILFNNFLSFNDGLMVDHVAAKEEISKDEANKLVEKYVEDVNSTLDSKGEYEIKHLGKFTKDASGILRFSQDEEINHDEPEVKKETVKQEKEDLLDIVPASEEVKEVKAEPIKTPAPPPPVEKKVVAQPKPPVASKPPVKPTVKEQPTSTKEVKSKSYKYEEEKSKNKPLFIFLLVFVLLPIIAGTIYYLFFYNSEKDSVAKTEIKKEAPVVLDEPEPVSAEEAGIVAGPEATTKEKPEVMAEKPAAITDQNKPHHLIVGSFKSPANADKYINTLQSKGFTDCKMINYGSMQLVCIQSFESVTKAQVRQEELLNEYKMESWILTKRK